MKVKGTVSTATSMGMFLVFCMKNWCSSIITLFYFHIRWFLICWKVFKCFVQVEYWRRCLVAIYIYTHTILSFSVFTPSFFFIFSLLTLDSLPAVCVISFFFFFKFVSSDLKLQMVRDLPHEAEQFEPVCIIKSQFRSFSLSLLSNSAALSTFTRCFLYLQSFICSLLCSALFLLSTFLFECRKCRTATREFQNWTLWEHIT